MTVRVEVRKVAGEPRPEGPLLREVTIYLSEHTATFLLRYLEDQERYNDFGNWQTPRTLLLCLKEAME